MIEHPNREAWFKAAAVALEARVFKPAGYELPKLRVGVGWPTGNRMKVGGQCFDASLSEDKTYEIFVSPRKYEPLVILGTLVHELSHTLAGVKAAHKKPFIEVMRAVGMLAPFTQSIVSDDLPPVLDGIVTKLGPYPHAALGIKKKDGQKGSRLLKVECPECGYVARITRKWLDEAGAPICPADAKTFKEVEVKEKK
ncbi:hypothetical protein KAR91_12735 [Candidatus Pacearchaeota archaeon]|nr:hypothetical protein [Candidatus Pacearchaeota archaeon]